ncbi:hypothetical protein JCM19037_4491 [Geomicrobium sp. JCM 19037]|uniref:phosphotransferase n=1 Tax=Geomicrobium sp. JCM 19037 TaxID=1460634 RepID=UPI00045F2FB0|nr:phosphotransferase [Geomicrobium sp. JCM 19037]GAK05951.1 hypothetical protein JCM19037_4491 [Geomicrobium sp. JCM 19037]
MSEEWKQRRAFALHKYLEDGTYYFGDEKRMIYKDERRHHPVVSAKMTTVNESLEITGEGEKQFLGSILWFSSNGDCKLFSADEVLTVSCSRDTYDRKLANTAHFSQYFRTPPIIARNEEEKTIVEPYIEPTLRAQSHKKAILNTIFTDYADYFTSIKGDTRLTKQTMNELLERSENRVHRPIFQHIIALIDESLFDVNFSYIPLHGDLWTDNLLITEDQSGEKEVWYIDYDTSGQYVFFYDFFKFMWNEFDVNNDDSSVIAYLHGEYDDYFARVFRVFNLNYDPTLRASYFGYFFLNYLLDETSMLPFEVKRGEMIDFEKKLLPRLTKK